MASNRTAEAVRLQLARFKEIFPAAAKNDRIDARKGLELFQLCDHLPVARGVLQEVAATPLGNDQLKRLTRRRRALVEERSRLLCRMQADLQAACPVCWRSPKTPTTSGF